MFEDGDLFACWGRDWLSRRISLGTAWPLAPRGLRLGPSHIAICGPDRTGRPAWWESTTLAVRPCSMQHKCVKGLQVHRPHDRIADYVRSGGRVAVYRLVAIDQLSAAEQDRLERMLNVFLRRDTPYDMRGALLSGTRILQLLRLLPAADQDRLFCSELCATLMIRLGKLNRDNPTRFNPTRLLRRLVYEGTYRLEREFRTLDDVERATRAAEVSPFEKRCA